MNVQPMSFVRDNALVIALVVVIAGAIALLRTRGTALKSMDELAALIGGGQPAIVEFYANT